MLQRRMFVGEVEAQHGDAEQQRNGAHRRQAAAEKRPRGSAQADPRGHLPFREAVAGVSPVATQRDHRVNQMGREAEGDEGEQKGVDMPSKQQGDAGLRRELGESSVLGMDDHAVEDQHHPEQIGHHFGGDGVAEIQ